MVKQRFRPSFLVLLLVIGGCTPKVPPPAEVPVQVSDQEARPLAQEPPAAPKPAGPNPPKAVPIPTRGFDESLLRGREFLLEVSAEQPRVRDPDLGLLTTDAELAGVLKTFFDDARDGALDVSRLVPRWAGYLQSWAKRFKDLGVPWNTLRVGDSVDHDGEGVMVPVRLTAPAPEGQALSGWVFLVAEGGGFLVSDVQIVESATRTDPFDPESSAQEISSPNRR